MLEGIFHDFSIYLNNAPVISIWIFQIIFCYATILLALKYYGKIGIYIYVSISIILANIQVLKVVEFPFFPEPMALGTVIFISIFLCTDILSEYYGKDSATKCINIGICSYIFSTIIMFLTISYNPINPEIFPNWSWSYDMAKAITILFLPQFPIIVGSITAFYISQKFDVFLFHYIRNRIKKGLWLRNNLSTFVSQFIDNIIFSLLAFNLLSSNPVPFYELFISYGLGIYFLRIILSLLDTPVIYSAKYFIKEID